MAHPVRPDEYQEINNFYTSTVYEKGAEVIRMQHTLLGAERLPARHGPVLRSATTARRSRATTSCRRCRTPPASTSAQFRRWYAQAGTPVVRRARPLRRRARARYTLDLEQRTAPTPGQPRKLPFHIPVSVGLVGAGGRDLPLRLARRGGARRHHARAEPARRPRSRSASSTCRRGRCRRCCAASRRRSSSSSTTATRTSRSSPRTTATRSTAGTPRSARTPTRSCASRATARSGAALAVPRDAGRAGRAPARRRDERSGAGRAGAHAARSRLRRRARAGARRRRRRDRLART